MLNHKEIRSKLNDGMWFLPSLIVAAFVGAALLFMYLDEEYPFTIGGKIFGFFEAGADAARGMLSTIASSVITVVSIAFSITFVALQQASSQYSPRVLRTFTGDKWNQTVLGTYLGTFLYALLVLRSVRSGDDTEFVPALSITAAILFSFFCIGLLIFFINQIAFSLQSENIVGSIHSELVRLIDHLYPETMGEAVESDRTGRELFEEIAEQEYTVTVRARKSGFLRMIDENILRLFKPEDVRAVFVMPRIGDFINVGEPVFMVSARGKDVDYDTDHLLRSLSIGYPRTLEQDPLFTVRMLVDVSLKALSPAVNDPTTAEYCLLHLTDALCRLANRKFPPIERKMGENPIIFFFSAPGWYTYLYESFSQVSDTASRNFHVMYTLLLQIHTLAQSSPHGNRNRGVERILDEIIEDMSQDSFSAPNWKVLQEKISEVRALLAEKMKSSDS